MVREFTCIICPNGCEIAAELEKTEDFGRGRRTAPYKCPPHGPHTQGKDF